MTAAPYPADTRAKGWRFEIDVERIEQSDTWTLAPSAIRPWLLMLWMTAWKQTPCGTLTNDDTLIAARIGMSAKEFTKHRSILMRGWWLADDGRLYHVALTERVEAMLEKRTKDTSRKSLFDAKSKLIRERDGGACVYCNARTYLSLDHLIAMSRGGSGEESNLVTACRRCNSIKGARNPDEAGMTFVNPNAERLWHAARTAQAESVTRYQNGRTREERVADDTKHQAPSTNTPKAPSGVEVRFESFWSAYPNKTGKAAALKAFDKHKPDAALLAVMLDAITSQALSPKWTKDGGQFIPNPATWLNQERWKDETAGAQAGLMEGAI